MDEELSEILVEDLGELVVPNGTTVVVDKTMYTAICAYYHSDGDAWFKDNISYHLKNATVYLKHISNMSKLDYKRAKLNNWYIL